MSVQTPLFTTAQGTSTANLALVSTIAQQVLQGTLTGNIVDVQINVNGAGFVSDPSLIEFDQQSFEIPNRNVYPEGLDLDFGQNTISLRAIDVTGAISPVATAQITILREEEVNLVAAAPSGIRIRRRKDAVELVWAETDVANVRGYNVYAATEPGGGSRGYFRINRDLITTASFQEDVVTPITEDTTTFSNSYGQLRIFLTEEDFNDNPLQVVQDSTVDTSIGPPQVRVTTSVEGVTTLDYFSFVHNREDGIEDGTINSDIFEGIPSQEPLYYVMTTVVYDPNSQQEVESPYSAELTGLPLEINTQLRDVPRRTRTQVVESYIQSILNYDNEISVIPGSVVKDVFIDPFATEAERLYFISDFIWRSQSFPTLLVIDQLPSYKQALASAFGFTAIDNVQRLINDSFEKLAANVNVQRLGAQAATGQVTFFTPNEPQNDLVVEEGTLVLTEDGSQTFRVTSRITLPTSNRQSYYNVQRRRWEIQANIVAVTPGSRGNVPAGQIRRVVGSASGLQVTNFEDTRFGRDSEGNESLASRAMLAFSSVDSGTSAGYLASALSQLGVFRANVIMAGHPNMIRDYDEVRQKYIGGKVDVWIQGSQETEVSDTFALRFQIERDVRFFLDSAPSQLIFIVDDPRVTPTNPITQMLGETPDEIAQGFGFRNISTGQSFDLTGHVQVAYNKIQLNTSIPQPAIGPNDVVTGDFRFRESDEFVFTRQPVNAVNSVSSVNTSDVLLEGDNYTLIRQEDPLLQGFSTSARDYLRITESGGIPSGQVQLVNDERHVMVGEIPEALDNLGATSFSIRVFTLDRMTEYNGPLSSNPDFFIQAGSDTEPVTLVRNPTGSISDGEEVSVDYSHDENFVVSYSVNKILGNVQQEINEMRHITADVLVKNALEMPVDLEMTVILNQGASRTQADLSIRSAISQLMNSREIGQPIHQSDIVRVVENIAEVNYVIVPFARMTLADDTLIVRENVDSAFTFLETLPNNTTLYALQDALNYQTIDNGGIDGQHYGVFKDRQKMEEAQTYLQLQGGANRAMIVGQIGLIIPGYSDDATLIAQGYSTQAEREARRLELTANRIFVSLPSTENPENFDFSATYFVQGDKATRSSIEVSEVSYVSLGNLTVTYR